MSEFETNPKDKVTKFTHHPNARTSVSNLLQQAGKFLTFTERGIIGYHRLYGEIYGGHLSPLEETYSVSLHTRL
ncbi:hypothetical protein J6590_009865 [Homalodisca vitripennis]|nr:hypothetical protein J6590_009865 [Homalodisca vitripennis]